MNLFNPTLPLTVRLRDARMVDKLNFIAKSDPFKYKSQNTLIVELISIGIEEKLKTLKPPPNAPAGAMRVPVPDKETLELIGEIKELMEDMHDYNKKHIEGLLAHLKMSERLSSAIYNMLFAIATDKPVLPPQVELGYLDEVPPRFVNFLTELLRAILEEDDEGDEGVGLAS